MEKERSYKSIERKMFYKELKVYFLILNLVIATIAFSVLIGNVDAAVVMPVGQPSGSSNNNLDQWGQAAPSIINSLYTLGNGPPIRSLSSNPNPNTGSAGTGTTNSNAGVKYTLANGKSGTIGLNGEMIPDTNPAGSPTFTLANGRTGTVGPDGHWILDPVKTDTTANNGATRYTLSNGQTGTYVNGQMIPDTSAGTVNNGATRYTLSNGQTGTIGSDGKLIPDSSGTVSNTASSTKYTLSNGQTGTISPDGKMIPDAVKTVDTGDKLVPGTKYTLSNGETGIIGKNGERIPDPPTVKGAINSFFNEFLENLFYIGVGAGIGAIVGGLAGGKNGYLWGTVSGASGVLTYEIAKQVLKNTPNAGFKAGLIGLGVAAAIFILTYKKENQKPVEFQCLPWQAPIGGADCQKCNSMPECSEYTCRSLGQACDLVNVGQKNQKCVWKNQYDTNSPIIIMVNVSQGLKSIPDKTIRPPATGVQIVKNGGTCIKAFTPLSFTIATKDSSTGIGEPSQCKIDYNLTTYSADQKTGEYDNMGYYMGGDNSFDYNHTETLSLPGPDDLANNSAPILQNDGTFTLYIRCQDANGNFNRDPFAVKYCVDPGPDTTPPEIVNYSIPRGSPIQFNKSSIAIEVYTNEPADCKWSHEDGKSYDLMEYNMSCDNQLWQMNNMETYTCRTNLTGIVSRQENDFYFRCLDKPGLSDRNPNTVSYKYTLIGTQPLNIINYEPSINDTVKGATDIVSVNLSISTDNGYNNGEALCYYSTTGNEKDYIEFSDTGSNLHTQRQDLVPGNYSYYFKCVDLGGNSAYNSTKFSVESDTIMPGVIRITKENGELKIMTDKESECSYSNKDCNFEVNDGIMLSTIDGISHYSDWSTNKFYYIRCKDMNNNQPDPNTCSIIIRPVNLYESGSAIEI